jgi:hypothetical protein
LVGFGGPGADAEAGCNIAASQQPI